MDYDCYRFKPVDILKECFFYFVVSGGIAFVFYRSLSVFLVLQVGMPVYFFFRKHSYVEKRRKKLIAEFAETLNLISANIKAGYSMENAFSEGYKDIQLFYGKQSLMAAELLSIKRGLEMNVSLEELFREFADRSHSEDIILFADVLSLAKRNGGKIPEVFSDTADRVREKICTDNEIDLIISEKKLELRIMEVVPFLIPVYLEFTSKGYFEVLYKGISGRVFMSGCLVVYVFAVVIAERIISIDI